MRVVNNSTCNVSGKSVKCIFACSGANANNKNNKLASFFIIGKGLIYPRIMRNSSSLRC